MKIIRTLYAIILMCSLVLASSLVYADLVVAQGKRISLDYVLLINSEKVESTEGKEP